MLKQQYGLDLLHYTTNENLGIQARNCMYKEVLKRDVLNAYNREGMNGKKNG